MRTFVLSLITLLITISCSPPSVADGLVRGKFWQSKDKHEVVLSFPEKRVAYYFNNDASRLCFTFKVAGLWQPTGKPGLLWSEKRKAVLGVLLYNEHDLQKFRGKTLLDRAANLQAYLYYRHSGIAPKTHIRPFPTTHPKSFKWTARWKTTIKGEPVIAEANKYFVYLRDGWIAQVTAGYQAGGDSTARAVIDSLKTTDDPRCYWPMIRKITSDRVESPHVH